MALKTRLRYVISLALAVAILTLLLFKVKWGDLGKAIADVDPWFLLAAVFVAALYWSIRVSRWRWMTRLEKTEIPLGRAWQSMLAGLGIGLDCNALPQGRGFSRQLQGA